MSPRPQASGLSWRTSHDTHFGDSECAQVIFQKMASLAAGRTISFPTSFHFYDESTSAHSRPSPATSVRFPAALTPGSSTPTRAKPNPEPKTDLAWSNHLGSLARAQMCRDKVPCTVLEVDQTHHPDVSVARKSAQRACIGRRPRRPPVSGVSFAWSREECICHIPKRSSACRCSCAQGPLSCHLLHSWKASHETIVMHGNTPALVYPLLHAPAGSTSKVGGLLGVRTLHLQLTTLSRPVVRPRESVNLELNLRKCS